MKSVRESKEFIASQIVMEARREKVDLSEVERKMLFYSETEWTLPDTTDVYAAFEAKYDQTCYEKKIVKLIRSAYKRACKAGGEVYDRWWKSYRLLESEDHYILVMIRLANLKPRHDQLRMFLAALVLATLIVTGFLLSVAYNVRLFRISEGRYIYTPIWLSMFGRPPFVYF